MNKENINLTETKNDKKNKSHKPDYCFSKTINCKSKQNKICFHILKNENENIFKNKTNILIYGPNGSGKTVLSKELQKKTKENEIIFFSFDTTYINKTFYYTDYEGERKIKNKHKYEIGKKLNLQNEKILEKIKKREKLKIIKSKYNLENEIKKIIKSETSEYINLITSYSDENIKKDTYIERLKELIINKKNNEDGLLKKNINYEEKLTELTEKSKENLNEEDKKKLKEKIENYFYLKFNSEKFKKEISKSIKDISESKENFHENEQLISLKKTWFENHELKNWINKEEFEKKLNTTINNFINWQKQGIDFYKKEKFNQEVCVFCLRKDYKESENIKELVGKKIIEIKSKYKEKFDSFITKLINNIKEILDFLEKEKRSDFFEDEIKNIKYFIKEIKNNKENWLNDENKNLNEMKSKYLDLIKNIEDKIKKIYEENKTIDNLFSYLKETSFFQNKIECITIKKIIHDELKKEIKEINAEIKKESKKIIKEVNYELNEINNKLWKNKFNIELKDVSCSGETSIKIINKQAGYSSNKEEVFKFASTGERKALALILFFIQIKRQIEKDEQSKYILIFDDISDELDFSAHFKIDKLLKYFLEKKREIFKNKIKYKIFLTHRIDFIFTFFMQHPKQRDSIIFFRLFNNVDHKFLLSLNFEKLMKTDVLLFREYLIKFLNFKNKEEAIFNQIIFWAISKRCIEKILTEKINLLFGEKINFSNDDNFCKRFEEYLDFLDKKKEKKYDAIVKLLKKWKDEKNLCYEKEKWEINFDFFIEVIKSIISLLQNIKVMKETETLSKEEKDKEEAIKTERKETKILDKKCPKCKKELVIKRGKFGFLTTCSDYPDKCLYKEKENLTKLLKNFKDSRSKEKFKNFITKNEIENKIISYIEEFKKKPEQSENIEEKYTDYVLLNYAYFFMRMIKKNKENKNETKTSKSNNNKMERFFRHANNNFFPDILIYDKEFFEALSYEMNKEETEKEENKEVGLEIRENVTNS